MVKCVAKFNKRVYNRTYDFIKHIHLYNHLLSDAFFFCVFY